MSDNSIKQDDLEIIEGFGREKKSPHRRRIFGFWIFVLVIVLFGVGGILIYKTNFTFSQMRIDEIGNLGLTENMVTPSPDNDRFNILLLGLRGEGDPNGGLLTDSIMILSIKRSTGQIALISIPRDLYVTIPSTDKKEKINFVYAFGFEKKGSAGALLFSKIAVSQVTGLYMNKAISVDHQALKDIVDTLGGITLTIDKPLIEDQQWVSGGDAGFSSAFFIQSNIATTSKGITESQKWVFKVPAGTSVLDGNTTLYFVRARYATNDFDRARRQQLVFSAMKDKALSLGILANPVKLFQILDSLGRNVRTDMGMSDFRFLLAMAENFKSKNIIHRVFDTTDEGLLYASQSSSGAYILLPQGDNFSKIREACQNIFE